MYIMQACVDGRVWYALELYKQVNHTQVVYTYINLYTHTYHNKYEDKSILCTYKV